MTATEYRKAGLPTPDETQMLLAANSRYEDANARRIHILPDLDGPIFITERKKTVALYVPDVDHANDLDLLEEYGCTMSLPLWVRPPLILPTSWAPWTLEEGRQYITAAGMLTTPYPSGASRQAHWDWCLENEKKRQFLPHALPTAAKEVTPSDIAEMNVRLWDDARGPGHPERKAEIIRIAFRTKMQGTGLEDYAPILPTDRDELTAPPVDTTGNAFDLENMAWFGAEEAIWCAILEDPDASLFGLDTDTSVDWDTTKNLFMESDNLLALKRLQAWYRGKVKLTYADPPYNTGNKFIYNDSFKSSPNRGSPFTGQRWGRGTWLICRASPWVNARRLLPKELLEVDDSMLYPRAEEKDES